MKLSPRHLCRIVPLSMATLVLHAIAGASHAAVPVQWTVESGGNGNWYQYVPAISIFAPVSFDTARAAAVASTHLGMPGYLATVTSAAEQDFINSSFPFLVGFGATGDAWLGASDAAVEGEWRWLDGPEAGQLVNYTNWSLNQPVSAPGFEDYDFLTLYINASVAGMPITYGWASKQSTGAFGYVIEYGSGGTPIPEPGTAALVALGLASLGMFTRRRSKVGLRA